MELDKIIEKGIYIAGACSIESREHIFSLAKRVKESGANILRGGAFKPRTSPYTFQGLGTKGIKYLVEAGKLYDLPVATEILDIRDLKLFDEVDIIQVGARNMQNFPLLKELGKVDKYILLKRSMGATVDEWLNAAEYIKSEGNDKIILCERGIRTFENSTRFTLDLNAIPVVKKNSSYPVIVDPSHGTGFREYVPSMSYAAMACGSDGIIVEVSENPEKAITDSRQTMYVSDLPEVIEKCKNIYELIRK